MHPKLTGEDAAPNLKAIGDGDVEAILMSHAHQDHIGTLALAMRRFPRARVFMTEATAEVGSVLLHNSVNVMTRQREEIGEMSYPLFTHREIDRASERWRWCPMRQRISIAGERAAPREKDTLTFEFTDAGHVLGSTGVMLRAEGKTVFYTGDVNFDDQTIMQTAAFPEEKPDVLIMECTRGDHAKSKGWTRTGEEERLGLLREDRVPDVERPIELVTGAERDDGHRLVQGRWRGDVGFVRVEDGRRQTRHGQDEGSSRGAHGCIQHTVRPAIKRYPSRQSGRWTCLPHDGNA